MRSDTNEIYNTPALVLYSGGKDSFLTACTLLHQGYQVRLLSINGGGMYAEEYLLHGVKRLQQKFNEQLISYEGIYCTAPLQQRLMKYWNNTSLAEISLKLPHVNNSQMRCLHCQTAMWITAIAYAIAHDIRVISAGYKKTDTFCTGMSEYSTLISHLAKERGIGVFNPLWEGFSDYERDMKMIRYGFYPSVLEPKCLLGTPAATPMEQEAEEMICYFTEVLEPEVKSLIEEMISIFKHIKLSDRSFHLYDVDTLEITD